MLNTWYIIRFTGLLAYFFLTMSIVFGMIGRFQSLKKHKAVLFNIHFLSAWTGLLTILLHMFFLLVDQYEPYTLMEIVIPFVAGYETLLSAIGTISFYLFFIVIFTSDVLMKKLPVTLWKNIHFLAFPAWFGMLFHGFLIGTDTYNLTVFSIYFASFLIVFTVYVIGEYDKTNLTSRGLKRRESKLN